MTDARTEFSVILTEIGDNLDALRKQCGKERRSDPRLTNWGDVGTVAHVLEELKEIVRFWTGEEEE